MAEAPPQAHSSSVSTPSTASQLPANQPAPQATASSAGPHQVPPNNSTSAPVVVKSEDKPGIDDAPAEQPPAQPPASTGSDQSGLLKRKRTLEAAGYSPVEVSEIEARSSAFDLAIALDQHDTLFPAPPTAFTSLEDAVNRLLPYHVWQVPDEDLDGANEDQEAQQAESAALVCSLLTIRERFAKVRRREGHHPSDLPSLINMLQASTAQVREELQTVQANLRAVRTRYDAIESEARRQREIVQARERERLRLEEEQRRRALALAAPPIPPPVAYVRPPVAAPPTSIPSTPAPTATPAPAPPPAGSVAAPVAPSTPRPTPVVSTPSPTTPVAYASPVMSPTVSAPSTPGTPGSPVRGRPRGRPRGRGRAGLRETVLTHSTMGTPSRPPGSPLPAGTASPTPGTPSKQPIIITVPMNLIPQFVQNRIIVLPADPAGPKPPATVIRTSEDRKNVSLSIDLGACNQQQLQTLARLLNVQAKPGAAAASPAAAPSSDAATGPAPPPALAPASSIPGAPTPPEVPNAANGSTTNM